MSDVVIKVENLWKEYRLGVVNHGTLKRDLQSWWARVRGHDDPNTRIDLNAAAAVEAPDRFWALRDVSFEVRQGEVLGIIGRNGAGKSTLLKILSRVTTPTKGEVKIRGRVASLLEVGTGFHPELTGRENIFLNGAILGMSKAEIRAKLDEIVDFSGVEKFIDTPVKRYSSGMYVRLAFAVAAHLDPEILITDEVLAVGDAEFQKKCLGKMGEVAKGGRTVLFVSHNMNAIESLCPSCMVLASGSLAFAGVAREAISKYLYISDGEKSSTFWKKPDDKKGNPWFTPLKFYLSNEDGSLVKGGVRNDCQVFANIEFIANSTDASLTYGYAIYDENSNLLFWSYQTDSSEDGWPKVKLGFNHVRSPVPFRFLNEGVYRLELLASFHFRTWIFEPGSGPFIHLTIKGGLSDSPLWMYKRPGILAPVINWAEVGGS